MDVVMLNFADEKKKSSFKVMFKTEKSKKQHKATEHQRKAKASCTAPSPYVDIDILEHVDMNEMLTDADSVLRGIEQVLDSMDGDGNKKIGTFSISSFVSHDR